jgi:hypothetical protein
VFSFPELMEKNIKQIMMAMHAACLKNVISHGMAHVDMSLLQQLTVVNIIFV